MPSSSSSSDEAAGSSDSSSAEQAPGAKKRKAEDGGDVVVSSNSSSDESSESSEEEVAKKKKKGKKDKKKKGKEKKKKKGKSKKDKKDKKGKKEKKDKKNKKAAKKEKRLKKAKRDAVSTQFGKYGVLKAEDFYNKKPEFLCWAMEVKAQNIDHLGQMEMKNLFKEYIEDYNTATMPSKKYYNLQTWDNMMAKKQHKKKVGDEMSEAQKAALASFDDEKARKEEIKHLQAKKHEDAITKEVQKFRTDKAKVEEMKTQERLRTQVEMLNKAGLSKEAEKIKQKMVVYEDAPQ